MKPLAMPHVRITTVLTCPNTTCSRTIYSPTVRVGELWMKCNVAEKQRRGSCPAHWLNLTLPPLATGYDLIRACGGISMYARQILAVVTPHLGRVQTSHEWFKFPLASEPDRPVHIQIVARARDEHHLRYAPIADVLRALQITQFDG